MTDASSRSRDPLLFTPGPLTTSSTVRQALLHDHGSRDHNFIRIVREIRDELLKVGQVHETGAYETVPMQGSGTAGIEAMIGSLVRPGSKLLVAINGAYGKRCATIAARLGIEVVTTESTERLPIDLDEVLRVAQSDPAIETVATVHCETSSGVMNDVETLGQRLRALGKRFFVDAMSSFGAVELNLADAHIDALVSSANKCIEGVPGFSFAIVRRDLLEASEGWARSVTFDLLDQWRALEKTGQFRFTPPTHVMAAFRQALRELEAEGGVTARQARYQANADRVITGMEKLGYEAYVAPEHRGHIITAFLYPDHPNFDFTRLYEELSHLGLLIYPGKVTDADCFRIGNIGRLYPQDMDLLLVAVASVMHKLDINLTPATA